MKKNGGTYTLPTETTPSVDTTVVVYFPRKRQIDYYTDSTFSTLIQHFEMWPGDPIPAAPAAPAAPAGKVFHTWLTFRGLVHNNTWDSSPANSEYGEYDLPQTYQSYVRKEYRLWYGHEGTYMTP